MLVGVSLHPPRMVRVHILPPIGHDFFSQRRVTDKPLCQLNKLLWRRRGEKYVRSRRGGCRYTQSWCLWGLPGPPSSGESSLGEQGESVQTWDGVRNHTRRTYTRAHTSTETCTQAHVLTHVRAHAYMHTHAHTHMCTHVHARVLARTPVHEYWSHQPRFPPLLPRSLKPAVPLPSGDS